MLLLLCAAVGWHGAAQLATTTPRRTSLPVRLALPQGWELDKAGEKLFIAGRPVRELGVSACAAEEAPPARTKTTAAASESPTGGTRTKDLLQKRDPPWAPLRCHHIICARGGDPKFGMKVGIMKELKEQRKMDIGWWAYFLQERIKDEYPDPWEDRHPNPF